MDGQDRSIYASTPFRFIIDGNPLYIHADLVSHHSKPLDRLMNGHMAEAQKGFAVLEDVDEETFVRFIQWAYNEYYEAPDYEMDIEESSCDGSNEEGDSVVDPAPGLCENEPVPEPPPPPFEPPASVEDGFSNGWSPSTRWGHKASKASKKPKDPFSFDIEPITKLSAKDALKESFIKRKTTVRQESIAIPRPRPNQGPNEDYTNIFLSHARLHIFADKYDIQSLKLLALEELQTTLAIFTLYIERTGDIIELLRYIYGNSGESVPGVEDLRTLMTHYIGFEMDTLMKNESFRELMIEDGGPLLGDFLGTVGKRI